TCFRMCYRNLPKSVARLHTRRIYGDTDCFEWDMYCYPNQDSDNQSTSLGSICTSSDDLRRHRYTNECFRSRFDISVAIWRHCHFSITKYISRLFCNRNIHRDIDGNRHKWMLEHFDAIDNNYSPFNRMPHIAVWDCYRLSEPASVYV